MVEDITKIYIIFGSLIGIIIICIGILFWLTLKKEDKNPEIIYLGDNSDNSKLKTSSNFTTFYSYLLENQLKKKGTFILTTDKSSTSTIKLRVVDNLGNIIGDNTYIINNTVRINYDATSSSNEISLQYETSNDNFQLFKLELD